MHVERGDDTIVQGDRQFEESTHLARREGHHSREFPSSPMRCQPGVGGWSDKAVPRAPARKFIGGGIRRTERRTLARRGAAVGGRSFGRRRSTAASEAAG